MLAIRRRIFQPSLAEGVSVRAAQGGWVCARAGSVPAVQCKQLGHDVLQMLEKSWVVKGVCLQQCGEEQGTKNLPRAV